MKRTHDIRSLRFGLVTAGLSLAFACGGGGMYKAGGPAMADEAAASEGPAIAARGVRAGEWDDNANYREFQKLLAGHSRGVHAVDIRDRQFLVVRDIDGKPVPSCRLAVSSGGRVVARLTTLSNGRAILFPRAHGVQQPDLRITGRCGQVGLAADAQITEGEGVIELSLSQARELPPRPRLDLAFVLDSTGSMAEEIAGVKATIRAVARELDALGADIRVGLVEFKDRSDSFVTRVYPMTEDLDAFATEVDRIHAQGGGDRPESVNAGLSVAISQLSWDTGATARIAFLVGDAPPHLDYADDVSYATSMRHAARRGIQVHTIAASGMDLPGQIIWRQIAQYTGGTNLFVLRGGAGPQSTGAGDPVASCGGAQDSYTSGNLDALVLGKLRAALAAVDADPMQIAGLGQDERAKPCSERVIATE